MADEARPLRVARRVDRTDLLIAGGFLVVGTIEAAMVGGGGTRVIHLGAAVVATVPLAWRRARPGICLAVVSLPLGPGTLLSARPDDLLVPFAALLLAAFSVGLHSSRQELLAASVVVAPSIGGSIILAGNGPDDALYAGVVIGFAVIPARLLRRRLAEVVGLTERAVRAEHEAERSMLTAAAEERNRLAREMHDIIGHGVSLMVVHAAAAEGHLAEPDIARHSLEAIQDVGRQAVSDLARMVGLLREVHAEVGLAPQPGISDLAGLVDAARAGGASVDVRVDGDLNRVPATVGLTAYRIVQEGLTNARRHADGAAIDVRLTVSERVVSVHVRNRAAPGGGPQQRAGVGVGLVGLRERVGLFAGSLHAGPQPEGGWALDATIPYDGVRR